MNLTAMGRLAMPLLLAVTLFFGCAKDTVSAPDGTTRATSDANQESRAAPPDEVLPSEREAGGKQPTNNEANTDAGSSSIRDAGSPTSSEEVLLRLRLRRGDVHTFDVHQVANGMGLEAKMIITVAMKVLSAQPDSAKIELRIADAKLTEGNEVAQEGMKAMLDRIKEQRVELDVDSRGRVQPQSVPPGSVFADMLKGGLFRLTLPEAPIRVGSTWKQSATPSGVPGATQPIETFYRVAGIERKGGRTVVLLDASAAETFTTGPPGGDRPTRAEVSLKMKGTLRVDTATGLIDVATSDTETVVNAAGRSEAMKMSVRVVRR